MKLIRHEKTPRSEEIRMHHDPLVLWPTRRVQLIVPRGCALDEVASVAAMELGLSVKESRKLAAFWFALGERAADPRKLKQPWDPRELRADPRRRYSPRHCR